MYVEGAADHEFTAFLAVVSADPKRVIRERAASFSGVETQRAKFLMEKQRHEWLAAQRVRPVRAERVAVRPSQMVFTDRQLEIALAVMDRRTA